MLDWQHQRGVCKKKKKKKKKKKNCGVGEKMKESEVNDVM